MRNLEYWFDPEHQATSGMNKYFKKYNIEELPCIHDEWKEEWYRFANGYTEERNMQSRWKEFFSNYSAISLTELCNVLIIEKSKEKNEIREPLLTDVMYDYLLLIRYLYRDIKADKIKIEIKSKNQSLHWVEGIEKVYLSLDAYIKAHNNPLLKKHREGDGYSEVLAEVMEAYDDCNGYHFKTKKIMLYLLYSASYGEQFLPQSIIDYLQGKDKIKKSKSQIRGTNHSGCRRNEKAREETLAICKEAEKQLKEKKIKITRNNFIKEVEALWTNKDTKYHKGAMKEYYKELNS